VIDAVLWDGKITTLQALEPYSTLEVEHDFLSGALEIDTLEGTMRGEVGDWIIKGVKGELYPCKPDVFATTYEPA
jgi:hypothetical protein